ncbi:MAG: hypothetical protein LQ346_007948 [Caloplaca aetnensis]|nr:MAG: hypothetical protein LQ346_007948 [Caloplaca aetnensis]
MGAFFANQAKCLKLFKRENGEQYDKIVIGAIILKQGPQSQPEILLLKRTAHETAYPNIWEIPRRLLSGLLSTLLASTGL